MSSGSLLWIGYTFLSAERYWTYFVMLRNRLFILLHLNKRYFIAYCPVGFLNVFVFDVITLPPIPILVLIISTNPRWCSAKDNTDRTLLFNTQRWKENSLWFFQGQLTLSNKYIKKNLILHIFIVWERNCRKKMKRLHELRQTGSCRSVWCTDNLHWCWYDSPVILSESVHKHRQTKPGVFLVK